MLYSVSLCMYKSIIWSWIMCFGGLDNVFSKIKKLNSQSVAWGLCQLTASPSLSSTDCCGTAGYEVWSHCKVNLNHVFKRLVIIYTDFGSFIWNFFINCSVYRLCSCWIVFSHNNENDKSWVLLHACQIFKMQLLQDVKTKMKEEETQPGKSVCGW